MAIYQRDAALAYAQQWAYRRNPRYLDYENLGGDCTNYVSQCLLAGFGEMNYTPVTGWYYVNSNNRTASWTGVMFLFDFMVGNRGAGPRATVTTPGYIVPGDIVQLGRADGTFYHSPFIVAVTQEEVFIAAHSSDEWMRPLSSYPRERTRFLHVVDA